jgi:hypothetical protein
MTTISILRKTSLLPGISYLVILLILLALTAFIVGTVWNVEQVMKFFGTSPVLVFFPLGAFLSAAGMVWVGIQIVRRDDRWAGWEKFTPLIVGIYPFVVMFPAVMITGYPNIYLIMLWGLPWLLFGISLNRLIKRSHSQRSHTSPLF